MWSRRCIRSWRSISHQTTATAYVVRGTGTEGLYCGNRVDRWDNKLFGRLYSLRQTSIGYFLTGNAFADASWNTNEQVKATNVFCRFWFLLNVFLKEHFKEPYLKSLNARIIVAYGFVVIKDLREVIAIIMHITYLTQLNGQLGQSPGLSSLTWSIWLETGAIWAVIKQQ